MKIGIWVFAVITVCGNANAQPKSPLDWFQVVFETNRQVNSISFRCKTEPGETAIRCKTESLNVSYYNWKSSDENKEPNRCRISSSSTPDEVYQIKIPGVWQRVDSGGGLCRAFVEQTISMKPDGFTYEEKTLKNLENDSICLEAHGSVGSIKAYRALRFGDKFKFPCSTLVVDPF